MPHLFPAMRSGRRLVPQALYSDPKPCGILLWFLLSRGPLPRGLSVLGPASGHQPRASHGASTVLSRTVITREMLDIFGQNLAFGCNYRHCCRLLATW